MNHAIIKKYANSKMILGSEIGEQAIESLLGYLDFNYTLDKLVKTNWFLENSSEDSINIQTNLYKIFYPRRINECNFLIRVNYFIFFPQQVLCLIKKAAINCPNKEANQDSDITVLGSALLATLDLINNEYRREIKNIKEEKTSLVQNVYKELILQAFYQNYQKESLCLIRSYFLYLELHLQYNQSTAPQYIDLEKLFSDNSGLSISSYLYFGFAIFVYYFRFRNIHKLQNLDFIAFKPKIHLKTTEISPDTIGLILDNISTTKEDFIENIRNETKRELIHNFIFMKKFPLLKVADDTYLPFSVSFLYEKLSTGIYWMLLDSAKKISDSESQKFSSYAGFLFQKYIEKIMIENCQRIKDNEIIIEIDQKYKIGKNEFQTPDILISYEKLFLFEISKTKFQEDFTIGKGDPESYEKDIEKIVIHNAKSLNKQIEKFLNYKPTIGKIDFTKVKFIYPVIISIDMLPQIPILSKWLKSLIDQESLFRNVKVKPLSFFCGEDIETLEAYTNEPLVSLIDDWLGRTQNYFIPLHEYLYELKYISPTVDSFLWERFKKITSTASKMIFDKEIPN